MRSDAMYGAEGRARGARLRETKGKEKKLRLYVSVKPRVRADAKLSGSGTWARGTTSAARRNGKPIGTQRDWAEPKRAEAATRHSPHEVVVQRDDAGRDGVLSGGAMDVACSHNDGVEAQGCEVQLEVGRAGVGSRNRTWCTRTTGKDGGVMGACPEESGVPGREVATERSVACARCRLPAPKQVGRRPEQLAPWNVT